MRRSRTPVRVCTILRDQHSSPPTQVESSITGSFMMRFSICRWPMGIEQTRFDLAKSRNQSKNPKLPPTRTQEILSPSVPSERFLYYFRVIVFFASKIKFCPFRTNGHFFFRVIQYFATSLAADRNDVSLSAFAF